MRFLLVFLLACRFMSLHAQSNPPNIEPELWQKALDKPNALHPAMIIFNDQVDADALLLEMETSRLLPEDRAFTVITRLQDKANATQPAILQRLRQMSGLRAAGTRSLWIINAIIVEGDKSALERIAAFPEVGFIAGDHPEELDMPVNRTNAASSPNGTESGLRAIKAPFMWNLGYTGYGRKVLVIDTGQDPEHPALREKYWGHWVPNSQAWRAGDAPEDCAQHGTHVTGTALGLDRKTNDTIGVAFNAHWMGGPIQFAVSESGCAVPFDQTTFSSVEIFQWALNPDGNAATTSDMPDVINCSWRTGEYDCSINSTKTLLTNVEAAGIGISWAAGNNGPNATTVSSGSSLNMSLVNTFAVGAVNGANGSLPIASFSSRGPTPCGGAGSLLIVAPGVQVRSSVPNNGYDSFDGTSMAAPHVSGAMALLKEAFPNLSGIQIKLALYNSAIDLGAVGEDNIYGKGVIDLSAAYQYLIANGNTPTPPLSAQRDLIVLNYTVDGVCNGPVNSTVEVENGGTVPITSMLITYGINNGVQNTFNWTGNLLPNTFTSINLPALDGLPFGTQDYVVEVSLPNGQVDPRNLNNRFKTRYERFNENYATASVTTQQTLPVCANSRVLLEYDQSVAGQEVVEWYSSPNSINPLATGTSYLTPPLSANTTYYVNTTRLYKVGKTNTSATSNGSGAKLRFTALRPFLLRSVKVYAPDAGGRIIRLLDKNGTVVAQKTIVLQPGENRVDLNFNVPEGTNHELELSASGKALIFANTGISYPYTIAGVVSITASSPSSIFYNYFFDWDISAPLVCGRTSVPVTVNTLSAATAVSISAPDTLYLSQGNAITFTDATSGATNQFWDFGNGSTGTGANPTATYTTIGDYTVSLVNRNGAGCNNAGQKKLYVRQSVAAPQPLLTKEQINLFPNPSGDVLFIGFETALEGRVDVSFIDLYGRQVQFLADQSTIGGAIETDVHLLPAGVYIVQIKKAEQLLWVGKFAKK
ncbi:MAG: S8 family serine peptidase [Saprospiraceae bacterium]